VAYLFVREPGRVAFAVNLGATPGDTCTLGRARGSEVTLTDRQVSRAHLRIVAGVTGHTAQDLDSRHGTFVNGVRAATHALRDGDQLQLGNVVVAYHDGVPGSTAIIESAPAGDVTQDGRAVDAEGRRIRLLHAVAAMIGAGGAREELAAQLLANAMRGLDADAGVVGLLDDRGGMRRVAHGSELVVPSEALQALVGRRESLLVIEPGAHSAGAPLLLAGRALGFIYVTRGAPRYSIADRSFLDIAAHLTAAALTQTEREGRLVRVAEAAREPAIELIGSGEALAALKARIERFAASPDAAVLIRGETGTGKSLIARQLHALSTRAEGPFVAVNCAAIPDTLVESELFGHEKGAFTGATRAFRGRFALAHGGTLFLDEVGDLSAAAQAKVLRAIEEREVQPLGGDKPVEVDVRILSATHKDLQAEIAAGRFRGDLYYRLAVAEINVPPLRDRGDDVVVLAEAFLARTAKRLGRSVTGFTPDARTLLKRYPWPGNVRQLASEIERAVLLGDGGLLDLEDLRERAETILPPAAAGGSAEPRTYAEAERDIVRRALDEAGGNIRAAARALGVSRNTLYRKLAKYDIGKD
jgi:Nif-specific regulatory protein